MDKQSDALNEYIILHSEKESKILEALNRHTYSNVLNPGMLSGHLQGRVLSMLSRMIQPKYILEIGTFTGYSALCLVEGLQQSGELITIDINEELHNLVEKNIKEAGVSNRIKTIVGEALEVIPNLGEDFDLVFIDADKTNYLNYYKLVMANLKVGAYIIADNVLWHGKVVEVVKDKDEQTKAILEFNKYVQEDERVSNVMLPIRDGLMVIQKVKD